MARSAAGSAGKANSAHPAGIDLDSTVGAAGIAECALSPLPRIDYADRFSMAPGVEAGPEQWARAMFGDVPDAGEVFIWRVLLGLRLLPGPSPQTVAGWRIAERGEDWIRLETASWFLAANLIVRVTGGRVALVTLLHYRRLPGHLVWPPCAAVHRRLVPRVFAGAVTKLLRRSLHQ
jgi:hypothetical protein